MPRGRCLSYIMGDPPIGMGHTGGFIGAHAFGVRRLIAAGGRATLGVRVSGARVFGVRRVGVCALVGEVHIFGDHAVAGKRKGTELPATTLVFGRGCRRPRFFVPQQTWLTLQEQHIGGYINEAAAFRAEGIRGSEAAVLVATAKNRFRVKWKFGRDAYPAT
jgi:hypothetical protein